MVVMLAAEGRGAHAQSIEIIGEDPGKTRTRLLIDRRCREADATTRGRSARQPRGRDCARTFAGCLGPRSSMMIRALALCTRVSRRTGATCAPMRRRGREQHAHCAAARTRYGSSPGADTRPAAHSHAGSPIRSNLTSRVASPRTRNDALRPPASTMICSP
jgi:hypothetical protein